MTTEEDSDKIEGVLNVTTETVNVVKNGNDKRPSQLFTNAC